MTLHTLTLSLRHNGESLRAGDSIDLDDAQAADFAQRGWIVTDGQPTRRGRKATKANPKPATKPAKPRIDAESV